MCHSVMNLFQAAVLGPALIYSASRPDPNVLRTLGILVIIYHIYQLYIKGDLVDLSDNPYPTLTPIHVPSPAQGVRVSGVRGGGRGGPRRS